MLLLLILQLLGLAALLWGMYELSHVPAERVPGRRRISLALAGTAGVLAISALLCCYGLVSGRNTGGGLLVPGGGNDLQRSAKSWIEKHRSAPPARDEVARNMRILGEGVSFLRAHEAKLPADARTKLNEYARLPTTATRMLSPMEERRYFEAAQWCMATISAIAGEPAAAAR